MIAWRKIISGSVGPIFAIFTLNDRYLFVDDRSGPLFWFLKGRCHGNQLKSKILAFFMDQSTLLRCHLETDCNIAIPISEDLIEWISLHCVKFGDIWSRNPRVYAVNNNTFLWRCGKNRHITPNISECPGPTLTYFTGLVGILVGMIFQIFVWRSPKVRCYGNQLNMRCAQMSRRTTFTLCFGIRQRIDQS